MKNPSELPDANEQAKSTGARSRPPVRTRQDTPNPVGQDQENRTPRRRTTSPTNVSTTTQGGEHSHTAPATQRPTQSNGQHGGAQNFRQGQTGSSNARPAGNSNQPQRTGGASSYAPRTGQQGNGTGYRQPSRTNGNTTGGQGQGQRQGSQGYQQRPAQHSNAPTQQSHGPAAPQRSSNGPRPNNQSHAPSRPGAPNHTGNNRPGQRNGTTAQRPVERRPPVVKEKPTGPISIPPQIVVKDLADLLQATPNEIIRMLIKNGIFASINEVVEYEKAALVAQEIGFEPSQSAVTTSPAIENKLSANEEMMAQRDTDKDTVVIPPVVTIMGHVDHGKTSLLDTIRKTKVAAGEAGGITQHIGAYQVEVNGKKITFLDTPGHEAFTAMRARGAQVTHIAIIVVAADDGVMPQTREAIDHARAAKVPIVIALNKIDKENANPDFVKQQLAEMDVVIEEYGGDIGCIPVSARKNIGIDDLLEYVLLLAEVQDIRANPNRLATGVIVEARLEKSSGPTATVLVQQGTLKMGDNIVVGSLSGKVRAMFNDRGKRIQKAPPSTPVSIIGLSEVPQAGDRLEVVADERTAKQRAQVEVEKRQNENSTLGQVSLDTLYMQMQQGKVKELNVVLKCDVQGSAEALKNALSKLGEENLKVRLIHEGIGNISETDVHLAAASGAIVIGFNVKADGAATREAQKEGVDIRYYNVIYKMTDDIQAALTGMLEPTYHEVIEGHAEVIQTFKAGKTLVIAGCRVTDGKITRSSSARILRKGEKVYDGKIGSLRRGKDDVREIATGYECGIVLEEHNEFEIGDIIEAFNQERVKPGQ